VGTPEQYNPVQTLHEYLQLAEDFEALKMHIARGCGKLPRLFIWVCGHDGIGTIHYCVEQCIGKLRRTRESERALRVITANRPPAPRIRFNGRRVLADVKVVDTRVSGAIDTEATRSFISRALFNRLTRHGQQKQVKGAFRLADSTNRMVKKAQDLPIELGNRKKTITLLTLDEAIGNLLRGIDFLSQCIATLQCGGIITKIGGKKRRQQRKTRTRMHGE